jgi:hypothetical protein
MEARPCEILEFFNGTKQMLIPLFQRPYEWAAKDWETLWSDILEQYERTDDSGTASHFTGAIVTAPARSVPVGVSKFLVIDGQQRLTTVALLLCAIRSLVEPDSRDYRKLTRLLINEDDEGLDHYKLLPTQPDREAFQSLVDGSSVPDSRMGEALLFFRKKLQGEDSDGQPIELERLTQTLQARITVVAIHLGDTDDPYLIFESLNAKGTPLTQADLIRNYLLLRLHSKDQQRAYEQSWLPMQNLLTGEHLTEFMRQYLMMTGEDVAKSAIYTQLKKQLVAVPDEGISSALDRMRHASHLYSMVVGITEHPDAEVSRRLGRLRRWEIATANPFLLRLLDTHSAGALSVVDLRQVLAIVESFAVRRAVCGVPTNQLKRIFLLLAKDLPQHDVPGWLTTNLSAGASGRRWPKDEELKESLARYRAYAAPVDRCKFILESIEDQYEHRERVDYQNATIEHVMPQSLTPEWEKMLGPDAATIYSQWLDRLGNLTLSAYNGPMSNLPFEEKKKFLGQSHFELNRWIAEQGQWTEQEIRRRSDILSEKACLIWKRPAG